MRIFSVYFVLLAGGYAAQVKETPHTPRIIVDDPILLPQDNYDGWINPENLPPMPQCIAQQDQSAWLSALTKCTSKRCTSHFGFICTHHQWLTELACLSVEFSSRLVESYLPYCARSILAKAQLYQWTYKITGRMWLVEVGDAIELQSLSPASLSEGYAAVEVVSHAPTCLANSVSAFSMEPFHHVMASCGFTGTTQHTGNDARPWEYREPLQSMIALDFETAGYDLVHGRIQDGDYFDRDCFCSTFQIDFNKEPCPAPGELDFTKERLWLNATCGSRILRNNWTESLKTTQFAYIPVDDWHWPKCVADVPKEVIELTDRCAANACDVDSSGYCNARRAIDRSCFCHSVSYNSCGGSCQIFETRIDYIKWLNGICGSVPDWNGLPDNWRQLAAPMPDDLIPWRWALKPSVDSTISNTTHPGYPGEAESCPSNEGKLGSFALVNIATLVPVLLTRKIRARRTTSDMQSFSQPWYWIFKGTCIAALQLLAHYVNALVIQYTPGYEGVSVINLMLLWCSMPRPAWIPILLIGLRLSLFGTMDASAAASLVFAETILQLLSFYYMIMTVNYGRAHNFYLGAIGKVERGGPAKVMYAGSLMWLMLFIMIIVRSMRARRRMNKVNESATIIPPPWKTISLTMEKLIATRDEHWPNSREPTVQSPLRRVEKGRYGTFSSNEKQQLASPSPLVKLCLVAGIGMLLLWIAQWLFWGGFFGLSLDEFCPPNLGVLTAVWIIFSMAGTAVVFI